MNRSSLPRRERAMLARGTGEFASGALAVLEQYFASRGVDPETHMQRIRVVDTNHVEVYVSGLRNEVLRRADR